MRLTTSPKRLHQEQLLEATTTRFSDQVEILLLRAVAVVLMTAVAVVHHHLVEELLATVVVVAAMTIAMEAVEVQAAEAAAMVAAEVDMKAEVVKNQLDAPYGLTYEGTFCCVPDGMVSESKLEDYKKEHIAKILKQLNEQLSDKGNTTEITEEDVQFSEEDSDE